MLNFIWTKSQIHNFYLVSYWAGNVRSKSYHLSDGGIKLVDLSEKDIFENFPVANAENRYWNGTLLVDCLARTIFVGFLVMADIQSS